MNKYPEIKIYDRFDLSIVFAIVEKFDLELKEMRTKIEQEKLQAQQKEWSDNSVPMPDDVRIELDKLKQKFTKKAFVSNAPEPKEWSQTKQWFEDFNIIWKESGETRAGIKYIKINGLVMDRQGYLVHRLIESE
jgi:FMN phosphatase YigB (HAD superfamily)